jgi:spore germination protein
MKTRTLLILPFLFSSVMFTACGSVQNNHPNGAQTSSDKAQADINIIPSDNGSKTRITSQNGAATSQIHVVKQGQSLFKIAQAYNTTPTAIASANQIDPKQSLVVGQALVIPNLGQSSPKSTAEFNAYVEARNDSSAQSLKKFVQEAAPRLTYLAPFSFEIQRDGSLKPPIFDDFPAIARQNKVVTMLVVTNKEQDQFSPELGHVILTNNDVQTKLLDNVIATAKRLGLRDIHWDIEHLLPTDRDAYTNFLRKAADRIHKQGYLMSTALAPKVSEQQTGEWYTAHDYGAHGKIADFSVLMTYEWGYSGGPAMAVSPIDQVEKVINYALTKIPASKILMGQNLYGYDWTLPFVPGTVAKAVSPQEAIDLARRYNVPIQYDNKAQAPHFDYTDEQGKHHTVWFEDARSIQAKFDLVKRLGLRGMSYWKLGLDFPQNWLLIEKNFHVTKRQY